jgi:hypothetical protein
VLLPNEDLVQITDDPQVASSIERPDSSLSAPVKLLVALTSAAVGVPASFDTFCSPAAAAGCALLQLELLAAVLVLEPVAADCCCGWELPQPYPPPAAVAAAVRLGRDCVIVPADVLIQHSSGGRFGGVFVMCD